MKKRTVHTTSIPLRGPLYRGERRLRIALVGLPNSGKSTLFAAVSSTSVQTYQCHDPQLHRNAALNA
jgi:GTPase SAR1 family protein